MTSAAAASMAKDTADSPLLEVSGVGQEYALPRTGFFGRKPMLTALRDIDLAVHAGEALGLVGESGSGKSTLARILTADERPTTGTLAFRGQDMWRTDAAGRREFRKAVQVVLQNPRSSLDPRMRIGTSLAEPLRSLQIPGDHNKRIAEVLEQVGLAPSAMEKYPHEFSGGQLQRVAIARALMPSPSVLIADEPVSALDVSIQAQVLNLLKDLVTDLNLALLLIAHDLSVVAYTTSRAAVMADGRIVEVGRPLELFTRPTAEPTQNLVDAVLTVQNGLDGTVW